MKLRYYQHCLILFLLLSVNIGYAQTDSFNRTKWRQYIQDNSLTFAAITQKSDSLFTDNSDSLEDGERANYNRWKYFWGNRIDATTGKMFDFNAAWLQKYSLGNVQVCGGTNPMQRTAGWEYVGPQNFPLSSYGRIDNISVNPGNKNEIYAASGFGGLWKTTDGGNNWYCLTDQPLLSGLGVKKFVVDYTVSPHKLYVVMGCQGMYDVKPISVGIFASTDDGVSFSMVNLGINWNDFDIICDFKKHPSTNYFLLATRHHVLRLNLTNLASPTYATILDLSQYGNKVNFLHSITFKKSNPNVVFVSTMSNWEGKESSALLFRTTDVFSTGFTNVTSNLTNSITNIIDYPTFPAGNDVFQVPVFWKGFGVGTYDWKHNQIDTRAEILLPSTGKKCLEQNIPGYYDGTTTNLNLGFSLFLPANSRLVVRVGEAINEGDSYCNTNMANSMVVYDTDDPTLGIDNAINNNLTVSNIQFSNGGNYLNRIIFEVSAKTGYNNTLLTLDNITLNTAHFQNIVSVTSDGSGDSVVVIANQWGDDITFGYTTNNGSSFTQFATVPNSGAANWDISILSRRYLTTIFEGFSFHM